MSALIVVAEPPLGVYVIAVSAEIFSPSINVVVTPAVAVPDVLVAVPVYFTYNVAGSVVVAAEKPITLAFTPDVPPVIITPVFAVESCGSVILVFSAYCCN